MTKVIIVKYGELFLKKNNKMEFIRSLENDLKERLKNSKLHRKRDLIYIEENLDEALEEVLSTFGIQNVSMGYKTVLNLDDILKAALECVEGATFKVEAKRSNKAYPLNSMELNKVVGSYILKNKDIKVDVKNPETKIYVEIKEDYALIYSKRIPGLGGFPKHSSGHGLVMISGGIDSPVAAFLTAKKGVKLSMVYFESLPHTSLDARQKVIDLLRRVSYYSGDITLYIFPFTKIQEAIYKNSKRSYMVNIMRRMMYRISEELALKIKADILVTGESIGQVASQTLKGLRTSEEVTKLPVIRPLITYDKTEIIALSKKIGTYDISIRPYDDCCTVFVPKNPVINPSVKEARLQENFDYESLIKEGMDNLIIKNITYKEEKFQEFL